MHRGDANRWTSSQPLTAPGESGVYTPHTRTPPAPTNPAGSALRAFVLALVTLLVLNAAINAALNPSGELRAGGLLIESVLASESHQKVVALEEFIAKRAGAPMGIVLGSSRVMELAFGERLGWRAAALLGRDWTTALREIGDPPPEQWFEPNGIYPESNYVERVGTSDGSGAASLTAR